jgi:hypothetical protein
MFSLCKDVVFAEQLKRADFARAALLVFADDPLFWQGGSVEGIYGFFRGRWPLHGRVGKPTGFRNEEVNSEVIKLSEIPYVPISGMQQSKLGKHCRWLSVRRVGTSSKLGDGGSSDFAPENRRVRGAVGCRRDRLP